MPPQAKLSHVSLLQDHKAQITVTQECGTINTDKFIWWHLLGFMPYFSCESEANDTIGVWVFLPVEPNSRP